MNNNENQYTIKQLGKVTMLLLIFASYDVMLPQLFSTDSSLANYE
ncbi:hypothetical protein GPLA_3033 [Paraglaciecola polaris LMG 21857]|uniref:Uncharacterized protein n=1 Tax=Paraglaciecola polaris LMG 21857 TaxID=1129793 RepID=K6ZCW2_9ALTE|nr:hypothetical protein GPLA_3033 [Paraglaciecola polaris LMG 21857]